MAVRSRCGPGTGRGAASEHHPLNGRICRRCDHGRARDAGYEAADPVCALLSGEKVSARREGRFLEPWKAGI